MNRGRLVLGPSDIRTLMPACPAEQFRRYRYRDPARIGAGRLAELKAMDLAGCAACGAGPWPCRKHRPPDCADCRARGWPCREHRHDEPDLVPAG